MTTAATITVSDRAPGLTSLQVSPATAALTVGGTQSVTASAQGPRAAAATMTYGTSAPAIATVSATGVITAVAAGTATITVTAQSTQDGAYAASSLTGLVTVTVSNQLKAQASISSITNAYGTAVDVNSTSGQILVNMTLLTNGANVSSVQAYVCPAMATTCPAVGQAVAAQQTFSSGGAASGNVSLTINTADFTVASDWKTATTKYSSGQNIIVATVTSAAEVSVASSNLSPLNFTNADGFAVQHLAPTNKATDAAGRMYYGGPGAAGRGTATVVPVFYTAGRQVGTVNLAIAGCNTNYTFATGTDATPWTVSYGATATAGSPLGLACAYQTPNSGTPTVVPTLASGLDAAGVVIATTSIVASTSAPAPSAIYADYVAPVISVFNVRGGGATSAENGWLNASYAFNDISVDDALTTTVVESRYMIADGTGAGLKATRDAQFAVCATPSPISTTAATTCATPLKTGGLTATAGSMAITEILDGTNTSYFAVATESDRLGNSVTSNPFQYQADAASTAVLATGLASGAVNQVQFGVDFTAPTLVAVPLPAVTTALTANANSAVNVIGRSIDSVYSTVASTVAAASSTTGDAAMSASTAKFVVRVRDGVSGFPTCDIAGGVAGAQNCVNSTNGGAVTQKRIGTFQITRRRTASPLSPAGTAVVEDIINTSLTTDLFAANVMNGTLLTADPTIVEFAFPIGGSANYLPSTPSMPAATTAGYYTFNGTVTDRAGNSATFGSTTTATTSPLLKKTVAIDNAAPGQASLAVGGITGGAALSFQLNGTDDLEIMGADLALQIGTSGGDIIRFRRVQSTAATAVRTGTFQSPFTALTGGLLASGIGTGTGFAGTVTLPMVAVQDFQTVSSGAPSNTPGAQTFPYQLRATLRDIRSMASLTNYLSTSTSWSGLTGTEGSYTISSTQVSQPATVKNWVTAGVSTWSAFAYNAVDGIEFRVTATSSSIPVPFSKVYILSKRLNTTTFAYESDYEYRSEATYAGTATDNGGTRYFRYTATNSAVTQGGNESQAAIASNDKIRAIGVDAAGNALQTEDVLYNSSATTKINSMTLASSANYLFGGVWHTGVNADPTAIAQTNISVTNPALPNSGVTTLRAYFKPTLAQASGITAVFSCLSSNPAVATATISSASVAFGLSTTAPTGYYYCDVAVLSAAQPGTSAIISAGVYTTGASGAFKDVGTAASPAYTTLTTVTAGALGTSAANQTLDVTTVVSMVTSPGLAFTSTSSVTVAAATLASTVSDTNTVHTVTPAFASGFNQSNAPMAYQCYLVASTSALGTEVAVSSTAVGLAVSCSSSTATTSTVAQGTGILSLKLIRTGAYTAATYKVIVIGRAVNASAYSNPVKIQTGSIVVN
jgi:hypothetical protein